MSFERLEFAGLKVRIFEIGVCEFARLEFAGSKSVSPRRIPKELTTSEKLSEFNWSPRVLICNCLTATYLVNFLLEN